jgi:hypothetical protein
MWRGRTMAMGLMMRVSVIVGVLGYHHGML